MNPAVSESSLKNNQPFKLFMSMRFLSNFAMQMQSVAIGWQVYAITGSLMSLGTVGLVIFIPFLLLSFVSGDVIDRHDRKKIITISLAINFFISLALVLNSLRQEPNMIGIYGILLIFGATRAFSGPATSSFLPSIVSASTLPKAIALNSSIWQISTIIGPSIGGLLYDLATRYHGEATSKNFAASWVYIACAAFYLISLLLMPKIKSKTISMRKSTDRFWQRFQEGLKYVYTRKILFGAISLDLFAVLLGGAVGLLPAVAKDILQAGPEALGFLRSAPSIGAAIVALFLSFRSIGGGAGMKMLIAVFIFGVATIGFGLSSTIWISFSCLLVLGATDMISVIVRQSLVQIHTPDELRGRVSAVSQVFIGASNELGDFESGATAAWWGLRRAIIIGGVGTCAIAALWAKFFPALRNADRLDDKLS